MPNDFWTELLADLISIFSTRFNIGGSEVSLQGLLTVFLLIIPAYFLSKGLQRLLSQVDGLDAAQKFLVLKVTHYVIMVLTFLIILSTLGIDISNLTVIFGLLSIGIGFGLQQLAANFISGIIILFEQPIKVGDWVTINNMEGEIVDINLRSTHMETNDAAYIIIPNQQVLANNIVNNSQGRPYLRIHVPLGVSYNSDVQQVHGVLLAVAKANAHVLETPPPEVWMVGYGESSVDFEVIIWVESPKLHERVTSEIYLAAWWALKEAGIEIPFPQRDIHIRKHEAGAIQKQSPEPAERTAGAPPVDDQVIQ